MLHVLGSETELQRGFEGIDVEKGVYKFFDETGIPLIAEFEAPNIKGKLFGLFSWVASGMYRLVSAKSSVLPYLSEVLSSVSGIEKNTRFSNVTDVHAFLTSRP